MTPGGLALDPDAIWVVDAERDPAARLALRLSARTLAPGVLGLEWFDGRRWRGMGLAGWTWEGEELVAEGRRGPHRFVPLTLERWTARLLPLWLGPRPGPELEAVEDALRALVR
jgi:hypothetical protein